MAVKGAHDTEMKPVPISWATKAMILGGGPAVGLASSLITPVLPQIQAELAHGAQDGMAIKQLVGIVSAAMAIGAPLTGFLADKVGLKRILVANYALYVVAGTAGFYLTDLYMLLFSRLMLGLGAAGAVISSVIVINTQLAPSQRATWMGAYIASAMGTSVVLHPVSGLLGELNWHWPFVIYALFAPFVFIALLAFEEKPIAPPKTKAVGETKEEPLWKWFPFRFAVLGLLLGGVMYLPIVYAPFVLKQMGISSPTMISLVLTGDIVAGAITAMLYGRARRYLSERGAFAFAFTCAGVGALITALASNFVVVVIGMALFGMGVCWFLPNLMMTASTRVRPDQQGRTAGLLKAANYVGSPIAIAIAEPLAQVHGPATPIMASAMLAFLLLALVSWQLVSRRQAGVTDPPRAALDAVH